MPRRDNERIRRDIPESDRPKKHSGKNIDSRLRAAVLEFVKKHPNMTDRPKAVHSHLKDKHKSLTVEMVRAILKS